MTGQLTYSLPEAAKRLGSGFTEDWLKGHLQEIPHIKLGSGTGRSGRIAFSEEHLARIVAMFSKEPAPGTTPGDFTPITRRRSA